MSNAAPRAFSSKTPGETVRLAANFNRLCAAPTNPVWTITWLSGTPHVGNVSTMRVGSPTMAEARSTQLVTGGTPGATYDVKCEVDQDDQHFEVHAVLQVTP